MQEAFVKEDELFIASGPSSVDDFLKTAISKRKYIHCTYPLIGRLELSTTVVRELNKQDIQWIQFPNTGRLYPPNFSIA
ncbi:hypothetical protein BCU71_21445 [Vibrio lentus]|nr:hypothetical protein [Vibrio sp. 070316B]PMH26711.1 hypothetical protein BCU71_21445 [Vibrio lentus]CAH7239722.1 conserved hypothetical protein [Vibrio chagasii]